MGNSDRPIIVNKNSIDYMIAKMSTQLDGQDTMLRRIEIRIAGKSEEINKLKREALKNRLMAWSGLAAAGHHLSTLLFK